MTADMYLQHQSNKQSNTKTDLLTEILNNINRNPAIYATRQARNINNTCGQYNQQTTNKTVQEEANIEQDNKRQTAVRREEQVGHTRKGLHYKKMKLIEQDLDALSENQTDSHIYSHSNRLANMLAAPQMLYSWHHYFMIPSIFLYNIFQTGQCTAITIKCRSLKCTALKTCT